MLVGQQKLFGKGPRALDNFKWLGRFVPFSNINDIKIITGIYIYILIIHKLAKFKKFTKLIS